LVHTGDERVGAIAPEVARRNAHGQHGGVNGVEMEDVCKHSFCAEHVGRYFRIIHGSVHDAYTALNLKALCITRRALRRIRRTLSVQNMQASLVHVCVCVCILHGSVQEICKAF